MRAARSQSAVRCQDAGTHHTPHCRARRLAVRCVPTHVMQRALRRLRIGHRCRLVASLALRVTGYHCAHRSLMCVVGVHCAQREAHRSRQNMSWTLRTCALVGIVRRARRAARAASRGEPRREPEGIPCHHVMCAFPGVSHVLRCVPTALVTAPFGYTTALPFPGPLSSQHDEIYARCGVLASRSAWPGTGTLAPEAAPTERCCASW